MPVITLCGIIIRLALGGGGGGLIRSGIQFPRMDSRTIVTEDKKYANGYDYVIKIYDVCVSKVIEGIVLAISKQGSNL